MKKLTEQIKQALNGLAYADLGERAGHREKYAAPFPARAEPEPVPAATSHKWIALGVGDTLSEPVMAYVIGACRRMQANLLLLSVDAMQARTQLEAYLPDLDGIECQTEELADTTTAAVLTALNLHSGLLFAVSGSENDPLHPLLRARRSLRSPVPVVLVSPKSANAPATVRLKAIRP